MATIDVNEKLKLEMNDLMIRFPHLMEQILRKLDHESLVKSKGVARIWKEFINNTKYSWVRIVKIPTILQGGDTYLHLAAKHNQIDVFEEILKGEAEKDIVNNSGYSPFLVACRFGSFRIAEFLMNISGHCKTKAPCGYPIVKMELDIQARFLPQYPFSGCLSDRNIWRLPAEQFHF